jgi:polyhydroxybutyrate depolymerase
MASTLSRSLAGGCAALGLVGLVSLAARATAAPAEPEAAPRSLAVAAAARLPPGDHRIRLRHEGRERTYLVHLPPRHRGGLPLVLSFHGGGGNAAGQQRHTRMDAVADRERFVVAYPDGTGRAGLLTWNAGDCCGLAAELAVDDVGFALAVVDDLARRAGIDRRRVYATGMSNGGMMAHRLAAEAAERIAAVAPVAGALVHEPLAPSRPVPVLHVHSVDDPRALYHGGLGPPFPFTDHRVLHPAVEEVMAEWAAADGCESSPEEVEHRTGSRGHTATLLRWTGCAAGSEVALWRLTGAGHVWPGVSSPLPRRLVGPGTDVIDANHEIWAFVSRFRR